MKRFIAIACALLLLLSLAGCKKISISYIGKAVLSCGPLYNSHDRPKTTHILTAGETKMVKQYLKSAEYCYDGAGCPFDENNTIAFGDQVFALATDGCGCVRIVGTDDYYALSTEGYNYIATLCMQYAGWSPVGMPYVPN